MQKKRKFIYKVNHDKHALLHPHQISKSDHKNEPQLLKSWIKRWGSPFRIYAKVNKYGKTDFSISKNIGTGKGIWLK